LANYQDCRIRCSLETADQIIDYDYDLFDGVLSMNKALGIDKEVYLSTGISFGNGCEISRIDDGRIDIGFQIRWYPNLDYFYQLIEKYPDIEWWMMYEFEEIYHYYYQNGEIIEDIHLLNETEDKYMQKKWDSDEKFPMIFTEEMDQEHFVNYHMISGSTEEKKYGELVNFMADEIVAYTEAKEDNQYYDYGWTGLYRRFPLCSSIRYYIRKLFEIDQTKYKFNVLAQDVLDAVQDRLFPYDYNIYQAVFGLAIGDALGVPYEFEKRGTFKCKEMTGGGTHDQPVGTWSDDTSMTLATLKSIKDNNGKINIEDIHNNFLLWINESKFTANGDVFDIGHATLKALTSGVPQQGEYSNGNGSLMRVLPLAFTDCTDDEIRKVSAITHSHWISQEACVIYVHVAKRLLAGEDIHDIIPTLVYDKPFDRLSYIDKLDISEIRSTGYVVDTLEAALWAVSHVEKTGEHSTKSKLFDEDVLDAVNLGDDTDTVGAVAGGLAGIIYGMITYTHREWFDLLRNKEGILDCLPVKTFSKYTAFSGIENRKQLKKKYESLYRENTTHTYVDVVYDDCEGIYSYAPGNLIVEEGDRVLVQRNYEYVAATVVKVEKRHDYETTFPAGMLKPIIDIINDETEVSVNDVSEREKPLFDEFGIKPFDVIKYKAYNKDAILKSRKCCCYYCKRIFDASEINEWLERDAKQTAVCPYCRETFVLPDESGLPVTDRGFIELLNEYWFKKE